MVEAAAAAAVAVAFFLSFMATPLLRRAAQTTGFLAHPVGDRHHSRPTPMLGGVAIILAVLLPSLLVLAVAAVWNAKGPPEWVPGALAIHVGLRVTLLAAAGLYGLAGVSLAREVRLPHSSHVV